MSKWILRTSRGISLTSTTSTPVLRGLASELFSRETLISLPLFAIRSLCLASESLTYA
jgi:hypothetical protein